MKTLIGVAFVACWALVVACGAAKKTAMPAASGTTAPASPMPGDPRSEIDALDQAIAADLAKVGLATSEPAACAANQSCTAEPFAERYDMMPRAQDATCKPSQSDVCTQSCELSDSVCSNADKICGLAKQMGGADAYANDKCQRGNDSCKRTRERCCGCT